MRRKMKTFLFRLTCPVTKRGANSANAQRSLVQRNRKKHEGPKEKKIVFMYSCVTPPCHRVVSKTFTSFLSRSRLSSFGHLNGQQN